MVEGQCEKLHKRLIERFRECVRVNDSKSMQQYAYSLYDFDAGNDCVDAYLQEAFGSGPRLGVRIESAKLR